MSQEQPQVSISKTSAAKAAAARKRRAGDGEPDSPYWRDAAPWYQPARSGDEGE